MSWVVLYRSIPYLDELLDTICHLLKRISNDKSFPMFDSEFASLPTHVFEFLNNQSLNDLQVIWLEIG